jgi:hypothetical protein
MKRLGGNSHPFLAETEAAVACRHYFHHRFKNVNPANYLEAIQILRYDALESRQALTGFPAPLAKNTAILKSRSRRQNLIRRVRP